MSQKIIDLLTELSQSLTPEENARLAGVLLEWAGVNRNTFAAFLAQLRDTNREELIAWASDADHEPEIPTDPRD